MNQSIAQIRDLFLSMTPAARITSGLLLAVIVSSLGFLFQQHHSGGKEFLFNGEFLDPREADRVEAAIAQQGLSDYERVGGRIRVPSGMKADYLAAVANAGALPANFDALMAEALSGSAFDSRPIQQQRIKSVLQRQLSMIVSAMDGVERADVLYDAQEARGLQKNRQVSATVSVRPTAGEALTPKRSKMIRAAVAGAISGLTPEHVTILNLSDGSASFAGTEILPDDFDDPYYQTRARVEQMTQNKIYDLLHDIPGVRVQVSADLDPILTSETRTVKGADGDPIFLRENLDTESVINRRKEAGQRPGTFVQGPGRGEAEEEALVVSETEISDSDSEYFPATSEEVLKQAGLTPKHVRVSVAIPSEYVERVWREQTPDATADERPTTEQLERIKDNTKTQIQDLVKPQLPEQIGKEDYNVVQVSYFQSLSRDPIEPPSAASEALFWLGKNVNGVLTAIVAVAVLFMLRSMVKSIPTPAGGAQLGQASLALDMPPAEGEASESSESPDEDEVRPKLKLKKGPSLREDLTEIVREDPDAAAAILRSWISKAA